MTSPTNFFVRKYREHSYRLPDAAAAAAVETKETLGAGAIMRWPTCKRVVTIPFRSSTYAEFACAHGMRQMEPGRRESLAQGIAQFILNKNVGIPWNVHEQRQ